MHSDLSGLPIFYEVYSPGQTSGFDTELDDFSKLTAIRKRELGGFCNFTGATTIFRLHTEEFREDLIADVSQSINRHRQIICALSLAIFGSPHSSLTNIADYINKRRLRVYSADANSPMFHLLEALLEPELFVYSEFFGPQYRSGDIVRGIRHEDLQATSFADESFDIIITSEVFEHIPDSIVAEREVVRILKPGGIYCFTVPCIPQSAHDLILAEATSDGEIKYFKQPQYHRDPVRPDEGILVYRIFSFSDLKQRFEGLGCRFNSYRFWSRALGIIDADGWVQVVRRVAKDTSGELSVLPEHATTIESNSDIQTNLLATSMLKPKVESGEVSDSLNRVYSLLLRQREVLTWIQTSRAWQVAGIILNLLLFGNRMKAFAAGLQNRFGLGGANFYGAIEKPISNEIVGRRLEVNGWIYSNAAPVVRVEAFLGSLYLGTLKYGIERPDIARTFSSEHAMWSGFAENLFLPIALPGRKRLTLRAFDARGHVHVLRRSLT